jgi:Lipocalin-like domain
MQIRNPLQGSWQLVRWEITYDDGRAPSLPYGAGAGGLIVYSDDGWMNACIARAGRAQLSSESVRSAPQAERLSAFESYFQYAGRYEIREHEGGQQVIHTVTQSLNPNFVGTQQVRNMHFDEEGGMTLSASDTVPATGVLRHHRLVWKRAPRGGAE